MKPTYTVTIAIASSAAIFSSGCQTCDGLPGLNRAADIPRGAVPAQHGTYACQWQKAQAARAERDYFVIYDNEWKFGENEDGTRLGPFGLRHVSELAARIRHEPGVIVIDKSEHPQLDESRRIAIVTLLEQDGIPSAESHVVVGRGEAHGLYGVEAPLIGSQFLSSGRAGGLGGSGGAGLSPGGGSGGGLGMGSGGGGFGGGGLF